MLFAVTVEIHTWAVKVKQHCTRGGEGGKFVPFGHDGCMAGNWKLYWNASTVLSGVVDFFCGGSEKSGFQWLRKEQFQNFLELYVGGTIYCFFNKFLILLGNRPRSESMRGYNWNNYSWIRNSRTLSFSNLLITRSKSRFPLLSRTYTIILVTHDFSESPISRNNFFVSLWVSKNHPAYSTAILKW